MNRGWFDEETGTRSAKLAMEKDWDILDWWVVDRSEDEVEEIEECVRRWFYSRSGHFRMFEGLKAQMTKIDDNLGLTEVICVDVATLKRSFPFLPWTKWNFEETPDLVKKIAKLVIANDSQWLIEAGKRDVQTA
jgi:hypothetical protein